MNINMSQLAPYIWILAVIVVGLVAFVVFRFFWHHILKFIVQGCLGIVGISCPAGAVALFFQIILKIPGRFYLGKKPSRRFFMRRVLTTLAFGRQHNARY